jgi:hypothetical protein
MPAPVTTLAFVNGAPNLLFITSSDGAVYLADLNKPEDSHLSKTRLPHAAHAVYFLPSDPFAVCVCNCDAEHPPRLVWFNMQARTAEPCCQSGVALTVPDCHLD